MVFVSRSWFVGLRHSLYQSFGYQDDDVIRGSEFVPATVYPARSFWLCI